MRDRQDDVMEMVMLAGEILLKNGAETYRVEETVQRIGTAAGSLEAEAFATQTGLIITLVNGVGETVTRVRRIRNRGISLNKVAQVNEVSRQLAEGRLSGDLAFSQLEKISSAPMGYPTWVHIIAAGVGSGCFAYLLGSNFREFLLAVLAGVLIHGCRLTFAHWGINRLFPNFLGGLIAAGVGVLGQSFLPGVRADQVIIGAIMTLVPGLAITHAVRDVIHEDLLSGLSRGAEAALVSVSVAVGVSLVLGFWLGVA
ncbi:MAG TPA: threonine/serine exporter family protein [Bacillota bacterium]|nr:threonine/serine exporter family protein [Bacillota bacterium]